ncbi:hypothetical protein OSB04_025672 [Centaurea solstitialis]|uniref:AP2/ERF domain-containing protein n=1 Tax=Centaurea solstitialis TaxID=347529 RepID=A0AA38T0T4_9ASTR|nr:hypothetical protein OSB04_025672 [Centaurea solstitialis]
MDAFNPFPSFSSENASTSDCSSSSGSSTTVIGSGFSEAEVMLASGNPKRKAGRKKFKETRHPVYRGVRRRNSISSNKWVCEVREPNKKSRVWLGTYPTAEMAARAHDVAVLALRGPSACLNFADSVWRLPVPESSNVKDIKRAAAKAAEGFRQTEEETKEMSSEFVFYDDEEEMMFPGFFASMAEGLMVPPPQMVMYGDHMDNLEFCVDFGSDAFRQTEEIEEMSDFRQTKELSEFVFYNVDEEEEMMFPGFLASMAEGLMVPPPLTAAYGDHCGHQRVADERVPQTEAFTPTPHPTSLSSLSLSLSSFIIILFMG